MTQPNRLDGGQIDRTKPLSFTFDGRSYQGYHGDTLASALLANDVRLMGRSFKYHRPRGPLTAGSEEPNALVEIGTGASRDPNTRATTAELYAGLTARSQNRWPSLAFDALAINDRLSSFLAAGFYYKTFMWPAAFWERVYEPLIRRAAGLGRASYAPDPSVREKRWAFADLLVIGSGPAGLMAALTALRGLGLAPFLAMGYGVSSEDLAAAPGLQDATEDNFVVIRSGAFGGAAVRLTQSADAQLVATLAEEGATPPHLTSLKSKSAEGLITEPTTKPAKSDARIGGMVATVALLVLFALAGLMIWVAS